MASPEDFPAILMMESFNESGVGWDFMDHDFLEGKCFSGDAWYFEVFVKSLWKSFD